MKLFSALLIIFAISNVAHAQYDRAEFSITENVAVIDADLELGQGDNTRTIRAPWMVAGIRVKNVSPFRSLVVKQLDVHCVVQDKTYHKQILVDVLVKAGESRQMQEYIDALPRTEDSDFLYSCAVIVQWRGEHTYLELLKMTGI